MSDYFVGRRSAGSFALNLTEGKVRLQCDIWQTWQPIVHSVFSCGRKQEFTITRKIGVSQTEKQSIEGAIEGSVGVTAIASLKSSVKGILQEEVTWESEVSSSQTFPFEAPKCGRLTALILQLVRSYDFQYEDRRWLHRDSWSTTLTEHTIYLHDDSKLIPWDDSCKCEGPEKSDYDGLSRMMIGSVSALVPYRCKPGGGFDLQIGNRLVPTKVDPAKGFHGEIPHDWLPSYFPFLIGRRAEKYEATFKAHEERPIVGKIEMEYRASVASEGVSDEFDAKQHYLER